MKYTQPKGTFDLLPKVVKAEESWKDVTRWQYLESVIYGLMREYAYQEIRTPIFEQTELFVRGVGETSDIVSKEMYTFFDKAKRSMSLRPEGTAAVMRAFVQNQLQRFGTMHKFFYIGPFFRYDRPQAGRYRQFHQFGVEAIGNGEPEQDFEVIQLFYELCRQLRLQDLRLCINTLGDVQSRLRYKQALLDYIKPHFVSLSLESQDRFVKNPLRLLDSKAQNECALIDGAPSIIDFITPESRAHFDALCVLLEEHKIPFTINPHLVRGLDYYNHTVFEVISGRQGAQNAIGGGGRYDGLLLNMGGPDLPCIGFSAGMERILQTMEEQKITIPSTMPLFVTLISLGEKPKKVMVKMLYELRRHHLSCDMVVAKKIQKALYLAQKNHAPFVVIVGEEELMKNCAQVKAMRQKTTEYIALNALVSYLVGVSEDYKGENDGL